MTWWRRLIGRARMEEQLDAELRDHFDRLVDDYRHAGLSDADARRHARLEFGGLDQVKEACRDVRGTRWLEELSQDTAYGLRGLRQHPAFAGVAMLTLAIGTGANLAVFNLVDALLLRPLPVSNAPQLVTLTRWLEGNESAHFSYPQVQAFAERSDVFAAFCGVGSETVYVGRPEVLEPAGGAWVSGEFFATLGVAPFVGRVLGPSDDAPNASPAAVITYGYWERRYGRDPDIVGRTILVEGQQVPIVGVTPPAFTGATTGERSDIMLAIAARPILQPENSSFLSESARWLRVLAVPAPGLSRQQLQARVDVAWSQIVDQTMPMELSAERQARFRSMTLTVDPGQTGPSSLRDNFELPLLAGLGFVTLVLLIACVNVANLLMARGATRAREVSLRLALGAGRARIVRQFLVESALLATGGAALGALLGWLSSAALVSLMAAAAGPDDAPVALNLAPNLRMLIASVVLAMATTLIFGIMPALRASAVAPQSIANNAVRVADSHGRVTSSLIVAQVSLSVILLVGAGLFTRSLYSLRTLDAGFEAGDVVLAAVNPTRAQLESAALQAFNRSLLESAQQLPGVGRVSIAAITPLQGGGMSNSMVLNGVSTGLREVYFNIIGPDYFAILGTPLLSGRDFTLEDDASAPAVVIVNERFIREFTPGADPFAQRIRMTGGPRDMQVIGVVRDAVYETLRAQAPPTIYVPFLQSRGRPMTLVMEPLAPVADVAAAVRAEIQPKVPASPLRIQTFEAQIEDSLVRERLMRSLTIVFGTLAVVLVAVGLYGLMSFSVALRQREIGVRLALGASPVMVLGMVLRSALLLIGVGVLIGAPASWLASRLLARLVYGLGAGDVMVGVISILLLFLVGAGAAAVPARRAAKLNPVMAIHVE